MQPPYGPQPDPILSDVLNTIADIPFGGSVNPRLLEENKIVRCGVAVVVWRNGKVLMGKRKGSHGAGTWSFPGGWMEFGESFEDAARRELKEETGMVIEGATALLDAMSTPFPEAGRHSVTILLKAGAVTGEPENKEPDKLDGEWQWVDLHNPPSPLFEPLHQSEWLGKLLSHGG